MLLCATIDLICGLIYFFLTNKVYILTHIHFNDFGCICRLFFFVATASYIAQCFRASLWYDATRYVSSYDTVCYMYMYRFNKQRKHQYFVHRIIFYKFLRKFINKKIMFTHNYKKMDTLYYNLLYMLGGQQILRKYGRVSLL